MGFIELSQKFLEKVKAVFNENLRIQNKRIEIIEEAKELPSPLPRLSLNLNFMREFEELIKKHYPKGILIGVTDTNSMEPWIDKNNFAIILPFSDYGWDSKKNIQEGDIILFDRVFDGTENVLHRVIQKNSDEVVLTRGDNLVQNDGLTVDSKIKGFCGGVIY